VFALVLGYHETLTLNPEITRLASSNTEQLRLVQVMERSMNMGTLASMFTQLGVGELEPSWVQVPTATSFDGQVVVANETTNKEEEKAVYLSSVDVGLILIITGAIFASCLLVFFAFICMQKYRSIVDRVKRASRWLKTKKKAHEERKRRNDQLQEYRKEIVTSKFVSGTEIGDFEKAATTITVKVYPTQNITKVAPQRDALKKTGTKLGKPTLTFDDFSTQRSESTLGVDTQTSTSNVAESLIKPQLFADGGNADDDSQSPEPTYRSSQPTHRSDMSLDVSIEDRTAHLLKRQQILRNKMDKKIGSGAKNALNGAASLWSPPSNLENGIQASSVQISRAPTPRMVYDSSSANDISRNTESKGIWSPREPFADARVAVTPRSVKAPSVAASVSSGRVLEYSALEIGGNRVRDASEDGRLTAAYGLGNQSFRSGVSANTPPSVASPHSRLDATTMGILAGLDAARRDSPINNPQPSPRLTSSAGLFSSIVLDGQLPEGRGGPTRSRSECVKPH